MKIIEVVDKNQLLALIIPSQEVPPGIFFVTTPELPMQLAFMHHPANKTIDPHIHNPVSRVITFTAEVLIIRNGRLLIEFYDVDKNPLTHLSYQAKGGDVVVLYKGGHGFKVEGSEDLDMIEIKQGPFVGERDKTRFSKPEPSSV